VATGKAILTLTPQISNQYTKNRATYSPTDELVLSDGVLWDVNSGKEIHKLDKLNQTLSGVFHPNGLEVNLLIMHDVRYAMVTVKHLRTY
jgi:HIV-1 Vpr-binding protein